MADPRSDLAVLAARNNAALCDAVCRSHDLAGRTDRSAWTTAARSPARYPDAVTLTVDVDPRDLFERIDDGPGCSIKDSFATLDLSPFPGWSVLFAATWIARPAASGGAVRSTPDGGTDAVAWSVVGDAAGLVPWEEAWRGTDGPAGVLRPSLLDQDVEVLAGRRGADVVAGAIANVSDGVVGVSNVFAVDGSGVEPWSGAIALVGARHPDRILVGYESGTDLASALDHGFEPIGPLRVWERRTATDPGR